MNIGAVETKPELDAYHTGAETSTVLWIVPETRKAGVTQRQDVGAMDMAEWLGLDLAYELEPRPDEAALTAYLHGEGLALLDAVCDGHETYWDGQNIQGRLTEAGQTALDQLMAGIEALPVSDWELWDAGDWLEQIEIEPDADIDALVAEWEQAALEDHVVLSGDLEEVLRSKL